MRTATRHAFLMAAWLFLTPILCVSTGLHKFETLVQAVYDLEVAAYCGLVSDDVIKGYRVVHAQIVHDGGLSDGEVDQARSEAWQAAHAEWQNRGLGGFRAWCAGEGHIAAESLRAYAQSP
ncbi:MAG: hypothetical protein VW546_09480 [Gammaproteobacteria bacterium]